VDGRDDPVPEMMNRFAEAQAMVPTGTAPADENSFEAPKKVVPASEIIAGIGPAFRRRFKASSLPVLRIPSEGK
jgi:hypothetical protein